jgi:hypothetical protein
MSYKVNDYTNISIVIEDQELPLDAGNSLHMLHISAGSTTTLPALHFEFTDLLQAIPSMKLQDGARIAVTILSTKTLTRLFRVHSWTRQPAGDGFSYKVDAYWDSARYWLGSTNTGIQGTSARALAEIAEKCGLKVWSKNSETADDMLWMPNNKTFGQFARDIAKYGYANDNSHMVLGVDTMGELRYLDVNANPKPTVFTGYVNNNNNANFLILSDFRATNKSGLNNQIAGYRHERQVQNALGNTQESETELTLESDSRYPLLSDKVRELQIRGSVSYAPISFGNVHDKYERGRYQNARYNLLNSVRGELLFTFQTDFEMGDNFGYVAPSQLSNHEYDGEFTVATKVIYITGSNYQEKIVALKNGLEQ